MIILGLNNSHTATAALLIDGKVVACISEERLSRVKNQSGLPIRAVKEVLRISNITTDQIDFVVFGFRDPKINNGFSALASISNGGSDRSVLSYIIGLGLSIKEYLLVNQPWFRTPYNNLLEIFYSLFYHPSLNRQLDQQVEKELGISRSKIIKIDHHLAHAAAALYSSPNFAKKPSLIFTLDAMGDGLCATVSTYKSGKIERIAATPVGNSIGDLYAHITGFLGMKMGEHEYKVMGLAPYAGENYPESVYKKLKQLIWVGDDMTFKTKIHSHMFYKLLPKLLAYERFDNISAGVQRLAEELLCQWVAKGIKKTGIKNIICGGGVFMNVKANQRVLELGEVNEMFIVPSCGDESTAIGAAYWKYVQEGGQDITPLGPLYLGPDFTEDQVDKVIKKYSKTHNITHEKDIEGKVASLLANGKVVARFSGKMEWGARAMGNRSILSHPANLDAIRVINEQIKSRDFWMPFAPSMLEEDIDRYVSNPKGYESSYMIVTLDSTDEGKKNFKAAMHQYDFTLRPQTVSKEWNPKYHKLLSSFKKLTGIGGVLNTSFNLHGFPVVCSPEDAIYVFENSGLEYLALEGYLISKKNK